MNEITLFDANGNPTAYISPPEQTVYLWSGEPVAYIHEDHVYGFNGRHLGWFERGIIWDRHGNQVGFMRATVSTAPAPEGYKPYKQCLPPKAYREYAPYKPYQLNSVSSIPLVCFLRAGRV